MSDETDTTSEVARVLGEHRLARWEVETHDDRPDMVTLVCACRLEFVMEEGVTDGAEERLETVHENHQAAMLAEAGLLRKATPKRIGRSPGTLYLQIEVTPHDWATRGETDDTWYEAKPEQAVAALRGEANRWAAEYGLPQIATQEPAERPLASSGGRGTSGGLGERLRALGTGQTRTLRKALRGLADEVDVLEAKHARQAQTIGEQQLVRERLMERVERVRALLDAASRSGEGVWVAIDAVRANLDGEVVS